MSKFVRPAVIAFSVAAAVCAIIAARIVAGDNLDTLASDIARQGHWAVAAALFALLAAVLQAADWGWEKGKRQ